MPRHAMRLLAVALLSCIVFSGVLDAAQAQIAAVFRIAVDDLSFALPAQPAPTDTVWLCKPGLKDNPCAGDLSSTVLEADGSSQFEAASSAANPPIDCFYVYPTVSLQKSTNASLAIDPEEREIARAEASRFSQLCQVYAPVYPQLTKASIGDPSRISVAGALDAYEGVWRAFRDYMAHYNHGRGVVFIGHSQGAFMLTMLLQAEVDPEPAVRAHLVSALLPGSNVTVAAGKSSGGDFLNIPACGSAGEIGCVVSYSSYSSTPPADALFGRVDSPINPFHENAAKLQVLCVNPSAPAGGSGHLYPYLPTSGFASLVGANATPTPVPDAATPFVSYPNEYSAHCESNGEATWLQIDRTGPPGDERPDLSWLDNDRWGLHMVDVNIGLGNLIDLVRAESRTYTAHH